ncbi:casein kinase II beta chain [Dioszegia hungarica]|uniref:Casein kinase II subunit beta n=1 Tax=Dioszegia hungarica TaxID=4972 RepID=A0AA38H4G7_9TREE|nr:casein kinase II beta chain [Dioszegia hungarica]KAI9634367.1 casein kinase II beta chain [Dioszegia hungarica]
MDAAQDFDEPFDSSSQASSTQTSTITWINWFTSLPGHDYFCEVLEDFIEDDFNLTGLQSMVPFWKEALEMVLDVEAEDDTAKIPDVTIVENSAELLYGLVHQRFILTKPGLAAMLEKYEQGHFGACPRVFCHATHVLPCGRADMPGVDTVKLYCPNCGDIYSPPSSKYTGIDGAFFGTTFSPLFFQTYSELLSAPFCPQTSTVSTPIPPASASGLDSRDPSPVPSMSARPGGETYTNPDPHGGQKSALGKVYAPRIYGFRVSERARSGPRMRWLRERPAAWEELDSVDHRGRWVGAGGVGVKEEEDVKGEKGRLFDDDDEVKEEDGAEEEEEEEEEGAKMEVAEPVKEERRIPSMPPMKVTKPKGSPGGRGKAGGSR